MPRKVGKLVCPKCGGKVGIKDSRGNEAGSTIRRRRVCFSCQFRFTTFELICAPGLTPEGMTNLVGTARRALSVAELTISEARQQLDAVETAQAIISGASL